MAETFEFIGGDLSLDLVNTLMHRQQPDGPDELLQSGDDARRWYVQAGLLSPDEAQTTDGDFLLHSARRLRTALDQLYRPIAHQERPSATGGLDTLNAVLAQGWERVKVTTKAEGFTRLSWLEVPGPADPTVRVAHAAAALLHRLHPHRLKECENPECDLLFYDESRNASRRWCSMLGCGNLNKQARYRGARRADRS